MTNLKNYLIDINRWQVVICDGKNEIKIESRERFEAALDILWGFRFKNAKYVYIKSIKNKIGCVASYATEEEAMRFFKKYWPNANDFVWANRH